MRIQLCMAMVAITTLTACGGMKANHGDPMAAARSVSTAKVQQSVDNAKISVESAQGTLGEIFNSSGTFKWSVFWGGVDFSTLGAQTQTCLAAAFPSTNLAALILTAPADIGNALKCVLDDVVILASIATNDLKLAMDTLNGALAQVAAGSAEALEIQAIIAQVQTAQTSYSTLMDSLAAQLNFAVTFLNQLPTIVTGLIPVPILSMLAGMTVSQFVGPITVEIMHFQAQLMDL